MNSLETILPSSLNAIRADGWEEVEMAVDSGASETVIDTIDTKVLVDAAQRRRACAVSIKRIFGMLVARSTRCSGMLIVGTAV